MIRQNMHIHSKYSWDSNLPISVIASILEQEGIKYGAITDHIELDKEDLADVITKFNRRNLEIDKINEEYQGKVILLKAAEISEPHLYKKEVDKISKLDLDFIMGSIHRIDKDARTKVGITNAYREYYRQVLNMIEANQIDVIGHLDYITRYYDKDLGDIRQINEMIKAVNEHNQIIEINTSGKRRGNLNTFPALEKICLYSFANKEVVIGTDAHSEYELADNLEQAEIITNEIGLKPVIYQKRKRIIL